MWSLQKNAPKFEKLEQKEATEIACERKRCRATDTQFMQQQKSYNATNGTALHF